MRRISGKPIRWSLRFRGTGRGHAFRHGFAFTFSGASYIVVCLLVGMAAANHQINLLFLIFGILLGGLLVGGMVSTLTLSGLRVTRRLPLSAMVGQAVILLYEVVNRKRWLSSYSLHVREYRPPGLCGEAYLPTVSARGGGAGRIDPPGQPGTGGQPGRLGEGLAAARQSAMLLCDRRGVYQFQAMTVYTRFPFSLFIHYARFKVPDELVVHPAIGRLTHDALSLVIRGAAGQQVLPRSGGQDEFFGLREYRPGDNPRLIHWRRSARTGTMVIREMSPLASRRLIIVLSIGDDDLGAMRKHSAFRNPQSALSIQHSGSTSHPADADEQAANRLELTLALTATLVNDAIRRGLAVGLLIAQGDCDGEQRWFPPASGGSRRLWLPIMRALASLSPTDHSATGNSDESGSSGCLPPEWLRRLAGAQCLWLTCGVADSQVRSQVAELANWNISVRLLQAERSDLSRLIVLPAELP